MKQTKKNKNLNLKSTTEYAHVYEFMTTKKYATTTVCVIKSIFRWRYVNCFLSVLYVS